jgi:hypothetical protein
MGELAASFVLDRSALAHNVKPLEREGLVEVVADKHDERNRLIALRETVKGAPGLTPRVGNSVGYPMLPANRSARRCCRNVSTTKSTKTRVLAGSSVRLA